MSELVSVLDVADSDELWARHTHALRQAGVFLTEEDARSQLSAFWIGNGHRGEPGDVSTLGLSRADRRLMVAWTWPNPWGAKAVTRDVFEKVSPRAGTMSPDPSQNWAEEVRQRVAEVVKRLESWQARPGVPVLVAAAQLAKGEGEASGRLMSMKYGCEPLIAEFLLELAHEGRLVFDEQFTPRGAWAYSSVGLRGALAAREDIAGAATALSQLFVSRGGDSARVRQDAERVLADLDVPQVYDPRVFHEQLPHPPAPGLKFFGLFTALDGERGTVELSVERIAALLPQQRPAGSRGPFTPGLPAGARKPQWWVNPRPGEAPALARFPQARAWLAAGMTAHPQTRGLERRVLAVRFDVLPSRQHWWEHRHALRRGDFTPWVHS